MERLCIYCTAILIGFAVYLLADCVGFSRSTGIILAILLGSYGAWLGEQLYTKIHH